MRFKKTPAFAIVLIQMFSSALVGFLIAGMVAFIAVRTAPPSQGFGDIARALVALLIVYPLGVLGSVIFSGHLLGRKGSVLFAALGLVLSIVLFLVLAEPFHLNLHPSLLQVAFIALPPLFACAGYWFREILKNIWA